MQARRAVADGRGAVGVQRARFAVDVQEEAEEGGEGEYEDANQSRHRRRVEVGGGDDEDEDEDDVPIHGGLVSKLRMGKSGLKSPKPAARGVGPRREADAHGLEDMSPNASPRPAARGVGFRNVDGDAPDRSAGNRGRGVSFGSGEDDMNARQTGARKGELKKKGGLKKGGLKFAPEPTVAYAPESNSILDESDEDDVPLSALRGPVPKGSPRMELKGWGRNVGRGGEGAADEGGGGNGDGGGREIMQLSPASSPRNSSLSQRGAKVSGSQGSRGEGLAGRTPREVMPNQRHVRNLDSGGSPEDAAEGNSVLIGLKNKLKSTELKIDQLQARLLDSLGDTQAVDVDSLTDTNDRVAKLILMRQQIAVAIKHQEARFRRGNTGYDLYRADADEAVVAWNGGRGAGRFPTSTDSSPAVVQLPAGGGGVRRKVAKGMNEIGGAGRMINDGGLRARPGVGHGIGVLPQVDVLSDLSGAGDDAAARERDAALLRKLPAGSRAFVERQRRARAQQIRDDKSLRDVGMEINYRISAKGAAAPFRPHGMAGEKAVERARRAAQRDSQLDREVKMQHRVIRNQVALENKFHARAEQHRSFFSPPAYSRVQGFGGGGGGGGGGMGRGGWWG